MLVVYHRVRIKRSRVTRNNSLAQVYQFLLADLTLLVIYRLEQPDVRDFVYCDGPVRTHLVTLHGRHHQERICPGVVLEFLTGEREEQHMSLSVQPVVHKRR